MAQQKNEGLVSVIIVTYHTGPVLDEAIEAVLAQTSPIELVLVNNGNSPETEEKLAAKAKNEPRIRFLTGHGNVGLSKACNMGAKAARGEYLLFIRPESIIPQEAVAFMRKIITTKDKSHLMLGAKLVDEREREIPESRRQLLNPPLAFLKVLGLSSFFPGLHVYLHKERVSQSPISVPAISGAFLFISAKEFWRMKGFDEKYFSSVADMDFCLRFRRAGGDIYFVSDIVVKRTKTQYPEATVYEKKKAKDYMIYFYENFSHTYPQPILWLLYVLIWLRLCIRLVFWLEIGLP